MRIGHGFDVHKFGENGSGPLIIGGVRIPYEKGLLAHSDGDVALHAATDALLGAAALGDIGKLFPIPILPLKVLTAVAYCVRLIAAFWRKAISSVISILRLLLRHLKWHPISRKCALIWRKDLQCHMDDINVKATTTEQLGFTGRGEGIACEAVALLIKVEQA